MRRTLGRIIFWDFPRASWQYDAIVILILLFIFATPRSFFRDQPRAATVEMLPGQGSAGLFWIAPQLLEGVPAAQRISRASALVNIRFKKRNVTRVEPILDDEDDVTGYMAYTQP